MAPLIACNNLKFIYFLRYVLYYNIYFKISVIIGMH